MQSKIAARICDTPFDFRETRTYVEALGPAGFQEGVTVTFTTPWTGHTGFLAMSSLSPTPVSDEARLGLTLLGTAFAGLAFPAVLPTDDIGEEHVVVEIDNFGELRWLRRQYDGSVPATESELREFARYLRRPACPRRFLRTGGGRELVARQGVRANRSRTPD